MKNIMLMSDGYKLAHHRMYTKGTELVFSNFTPRASKYAPVGAPKNGIIVMGVKKLIEDLHANFEEFFNNDFDDSVNEMLDNYLMDHYDMTHFKELHELGYLPVEIRALAEGSFCPIGVPFFTIHNTDKKFFWLTNFLETYISANLWRCSSAASVASSYYRVSKEWFTKTCEGVSSAFNVHNFSARGMDSLDAMIQADLGHLLFFNGSDTLPTMQTLKDLYGVTNYMGNVPACFPDGAEVLTQRGFVEFVDLTDDDVVAQYDEDGYISFVKPIKVHEYEYKGELISVKSSSNINTLVTPNHRIPYITEADNLKIVEAKDLINKPKFILSGTTSEGEGLSDYEKLLIAFQADGSFSTRVDSYNGVRKGTLPIRFATLKKNRKIERLELILSNLGFKYTKHELNRGGYSFRIEVPFTDKLSKQFDWVNFSKISKDWAVDFLTELQFWDGCAKRDNYITYSSTIKENIDVVQALCTLSNSRSHYKLYNDKRVNRKPLHVVSIQIGKNSTFKPKEDIEKTAVPYEGVVRCVTVPSGMIVVRQNDKVMISGNSEHSVMCAGGKETELDTYRNLLNEFPSGFLSLVSDTWDLWNVITNILPQLKDQIMSRDGRLVIRPDSGNPVDIICGELHDEVNIIDLEKSLHNGRHYINNSDYRGIIKIDFDVIVEDYLVKDEYGDLYEVNFRSDESSDTYFTVGNKVGNISEPKQKGVIELLWDIFGGHVNDQGYKVLDSHIGLIYGDSITIERAKQIYKRLEAKGFASCNVVLGAGSYSYGYQLGRDTYGCAMKATYVEINGEGHNIFKDPVTDDGTKKSATGLLAVMENKGAHGTSNPYLVQEATWDDVTSDENLLKIVYKDGNKIFEDSWEKIIQRARQNSDRLDF